MSILECLLLGLFLRCMKYSLLLFLLCHLASPAFGQANDIFFSDFASREKFIDSIFKTQSDQRLKDTVAFNQLINPYLTQARNKNDQALIERLHLECFRYRLQQEGRSHTANLRDYNYLTDNFSSKDKHYLEVIAMQAYANYLRDLGKNYAFTFELYIEAFYKYENFTIKDFPHKVDYLYDIGIAYYQFRDFENTIHYLTKAVAESNNLYERNTGLVNTIGLSYRELGKLDSAMIYFRKLNQFALRKNDPSWILISRLNIGHTYFMSQNYTMAKKEMEFCHTYAVKTNQKFGISEACIALAQIALLEHNYLLAQQKALEPYKIWKEKFGEKWIQERMSVAKDIFDILAKVYAHNGNYALAYQYRDSSLVIKDSLNRQYNALQLSTAQHKVVLSKYQQEKQALNFERKKQTLIRNALLIIIFLSSIIALLFINNQRLKRKKLEDDKKNAEAKLNDFTKALQQKTELIEQFSTELEQYREKKTEDNRNDIIFQLQQSTILTDEQWDEFRNMFEQVHRGFLTRLKQKMPDLTPAEIRFVVLSKLNLSPKDMAHVLGVGPSAIRKYRYRLRNKLHLPEDGSIDEVIAMI